MAFLISREICSAFFFCYFKLFPFFSHRCFTRKLQKLCVFLAPPAYISTKMAQLWAAEAASAANNLAILERMHVESFPSRRWGAGFSYYSFESSFCGRVGGGVCAGEHFIRDVFRWLSEKQTKCVCATSHEERFLGGGGWWCKINHLPRMCVCVYGIHLLLTFSYAAELTSKTTTYTNGERSGSDGNFGTSNARGKFPFASLFRGSVCLLVAVAGASA